MKQVDLKLEQFKTQKKDLTTRMEAINRNKNRLSDDNEKLQEEITRIETE